jgi:hypothetical protein
MTGSEAADSSSIADSDDGGDTVPEGNRSSSERYELAEDSSVSEEKSDGRLGHDGKAQAALIPIADEKDVLRGLRSNKPSLGDGGGGGGGNDDGDGEEAVLVL